MTPGQWRAANHVSRRTHGHTVHYQTSPETALCGRELKHTREPTIDGTPWDINNHHTCKSCRAWYLLFYARESKGELNTPLK